LGDLSEDAKRGKNDEKDYGLEPLLASKNKLGVGSI
jgi:hypothetical protein